MPERTTDSAERITAKRRLAVGGTAAAVLLATGAYVLHAQGEQSSARQKACTEGTSTFWPDEEEYISLDTSTNVKLAVQGWNVTKPQVTVALQEQTGDPNYSVQVPVAELASFGDSKTVYGHDDPAAYGNAGDLRQLSLELTYRDYTHGKVVVGWHYFCNPKPPA